VRAATVECSEVRLEDPSKIYLVRHGETDWSLSGQHTSSTDIALTQRGEDQGRNLGRRLAGIEFAHVLCSPRRRALRTCELAGLVSKRRIVPELSEWGYGAYEGLRTAEIRKARPDWELWRDGCPDGETPAQVADRADRVIEQVSTLRGNIALFSHGHFGCALGARWIELDIANGRRFMLDPASISILGAAPRHPETHVVCSWNVAAEGP